MFNKSLNYMLMVCLIFSFLLLIGLSSPIFILIALFFLSIILCYSKSVSEILCYLLFVLSFSPIFKISPDSNTLFNVIILISIIKCIFLIKNLSFSYAEILSILFFISFVFIIGGIESTPMLIKLVMYFVLMLLIFKSNQKINLYPVIFFFSLGIIVTSVTGLFIDSIPGLSKYIELSDYRIGFYETVNRFSGITSSPNAYTMDISIALAGWFSLIIGKKINVLGYIMIILLLIFGLMSLSKSFLLSLVVLLILVSLNLVVKNIRDLIKAIFLFSFIIVGVYFFIDTEYLQAFIQRLAIDSSSTSDLSSITTGRVDIWKDYISYIFSDITVFLFGEGLENELFRPSHNYVLETLYYFGIIGTFIYLFCIMNLFPKMNHYFRKNLANFYPLITLLVRAMGINLILSESLIFYFIIIAITLNTNFSNKSSDIKKTID